MTFLTRLGLANKAVVVLATLVIIGVGLFAMRGLRQELIPSITIPGAGVVAVYPGAGPTAVETEVTQPLETALKQVDGVTSVNSTSANNVAQIQVEWDFSENTDQMVADLRSAIDGAKANLPQDVDPEVFSGGFEDVPVIYLAVSSDKAPAELAQDLENVAIPKLSELEGVRTAAISGQEVREVVISERPADADRLNVDLSQLQQVLPMYKAPVPAGALAEAGQDRNVQVGVALGSVEAVQNLQLQGSDGPVALSSVADVADLPAPVTTYSRVNGEPSLALAVMKTQDANTVTVANEVRDALPELQREIGGGITFETVFDQAPFIEQSIHDLEVEGGLGLLMAVLVILLFLRSGRPTIITAISIPLSLLIALISMFLADYTLNLLTLSALTVAVGRVVDDSIVVIENIERHRDEGEAFDSRLIVGAVKEVAGAVTSSTLTTVAVFLPLGLVSGQTGELFRPFALTVMVALLASLLVSLTIVPVLASWFMRPRTRPLSEQRQARQQARAERRAEAAAARATAEAERDRARRDKDFVRAQRRHAKAEQAFRAQLARRNLEPAAADDAVAAWYQQNPAPVALPEQSSAVAVHHVHDSAETALQRWYLPVLRWSLHHPVVTLVVAVLVFVLTMGMTTLLKTDFIGEAEQTTLQVSTTLPPGTDLDTTDAATRKIEGVLAQDPAVLNYQTTVGGGSAEQQFSGTGGGANTATISVNLKPESNGRVVADRLSAQYQDITDAGEIEVGLAGGTGSTQVAIEVQGTDEATLAQGSQQIVDMMSGIDGLETVKSDLSEQQTLLQVDINEPVAARYGMSQGTIGQAVRTAIDGTQLGSMTIDDVNRDIYLRSATPVKTKADLENLLLPVTQKQTVDAQKAEADRLKAEAEAKSQEQLADSLDELDKQQRELRRGRTELADQLSALRAQLAAARSGGGNAAPVDPTQLDPNAIAAQQRAAQLAQLQEAIDQMEKQIDQLDEQIAGMDDQRKQIRDQAAEAKQAQAEQEAAAEIEGSPIRLNRVATVDEVPGPASIRRSDGTRTVTVTAASTSDNLGATTAQLQQGLTRTDLPSGVTASIGGVSQEQNEAFAQLLLAMAVAIALVYIIMVATFRSLLQPLILLVSVPFAATGAILLLLVTGTPLGVPAMIGLLMLIGIVVTNAIVLIDLVNQFRQRGASVDDAVIHGSRLRLRPIIMTALATIMALLPMGLGLTGGGVFISKPLAIVVIGGLITSTLLTLVLVPVLYHVVEGLRERMRGGRTRTPGPAEEDPGVDGLDDLLHKDHGPGPAPATG